MTNPNSLPDLLAQASNSSLRESAEKLLSEVSDRWLFIHTKILNRLLVRPDEAEEHNQKVNLVIKAFQSQLNQILDYLEVEKKPDLAHYRIGTYDDVRKGKVDGFNQCAKTTNKKIKKVREWIK